MHAAPSQSSPSAAGAPRSVAWRALIVWVLAVSCVSALVAVPYAIFHSLRLGHETVCIRDSVTGAFADGHDAGWSRIVEVRAGGCLFGLARLVVRFTDVPQEVHEALSAARSASVGVYQWRGADLDRTRDHMAAASSVRVDGREWTRIVSVRSDAESVVILTPSMPAADPDDVELCVVVMSDGELVVVRLEVDAAPLGDLVQPHLREIRRELRDSV